MRKPIIAGNWKMNKLAADGARFVMLFATKYRKAQKWTQSSVRRSSTCRF